MPDQGTNRCGVRKEAASWLVGGQEGEGSALGPLLGGGTNHAHEGFTLRTYHLSKAPLLTPLHCGVGFNIQIWGGISLQPIARLSC